MSILSPIKFDAEKTLREKEITQRLVDIRTAEIEFRDQKSGFTDNWAELLTFLKTAKKKQVLKEGALTDAQLEAGLTEAKAVKIVNSGKMKDIVSNGLEGFRRDTAYLEMIPALFPSGRYTAENIDEIARVPYSDTARFVLQTNNGYINTNGILIPLFEASVEYKVYLSDLNRQELLNIIDLDKKLEKFPGRKVGSVDEPNNNAGNWE
jgi:hypothetical protein